MALLHDLTSVFLGMEEESYGPIVCDSGGKEGLTHAGETDFA